MVARRVPMGSMRIVMQVVPMIPTHRPLSFFRRLLLAMCLAAATGHAGAQAIPSYVFSGPLLPLLAQMPGNSWLLASANLYRDAWTAPDLVPLAHGDPRLPARIIDSWSGFAWDSNRGDLLLFGGGHANYAGNEIYRWRSRTLNWERASLPSEIRSDPVLGEIAVDGVDNAPISSHVYDNNQFLPVADRFLTWGGAAYNNGGPFIRFLESSPAQTRLTGPYLFDPARADGNKVGGSTGSHVTRVAPHAEVVGGAMWENRDIHRWLAGQELPGTHVNGCTGYANEGGRDVLYVASANRNTTSRNLYRYQLSDIGTPAADTSTKVGRYDVGVSGQITCAYDPARRLFLRTGNNATPLQYWDLGAPGPNNPDRNVEINASLQAFQAWLAANALDLQNCALELDAPRRRFLLWCGAATVWAVVPPAGGNLAAGWAVQQLPLPQSPAPSGDVGTGVLGKWQYAPHFDVFVGLQGSVAGDVWLYKPESWVQPNPAGNALPTVSVTAPPAGAQIPAGSTYELRASANDSDGAIDRVEYYIDGIIVGKSTSPPFALTVRPLLVGDYSVVAVAIDRVGGMTVSAPVAFSVTGSVATTVLQRGRAGYQGVADTYLDGYGPSVNRGTADPLYLDPSLTPLIRFAIFAAEGGPVPDGSVVQSATLELHKQHYDTPLELSALLVPWAEGQATWRDRVAGVGWTVSGAGGAGTDHHPVPDSVVRGSFNPGWVAFDVTTRVRGWSEGLTTNHGWRITQGSPQYVLKQFAASEHGADPSLRPRLTVVYATVAPNQKPTAAITAPADGAKVILGNPVALAATAVDTDGVVAEVTFQVDGVPIGTAGAAPYAVTWAPTATGRYTIAAIATDNRGATSAPATITVDVELAPNVAPTITIDAPGSGATLVVGRPATLAATANDTDGTIVQVVFLANGKAVGTDTAPPFAVAWTPLTEGSYDISAIATDNRGAASTAIPVTVQAVLPPNVPPTVAISVAGPAGRLALGNGIALAADASDPDGSIRQVAFHADGVLLGSVAAPPYVLTWRPVVVGTYALTAVATDNRGASTTSTAAVVEVVRSTNAAPTVSVAAPADGTSVTLGAGVTVAANASDADGFVTQVAMYADGALVGIATTPPYAVTWVPAAAGNIVVTAVATDNRGATGVSSPVTLAVVSPPTTRVLQRDLHGYRGVNDAYLDQAAPVTARGDDRWLVAAGSRQVPVVRFAVFRSEGGPIPDGASILSAALEVHGEGIVGNYLVHAVLAPWREREVTWYERQAGLAWHGAGAGAAGVDFVAEPDAQGVVVSDPGWLRFDVTERVRQWSANAMPNGGWRLIQSGRLGTKQFRASEDSDRTRRPRLTIVYR
jgi:hypothetical protein